MSALAAKTSGANPTGGKLHILEKRLREVEKEKDAFISIVSHELRTPLAVIKGYLDLAADGILGDIPEHLREPILKSKDSADRLHRLIENLLDISRLESPETAMKFKSISLHVAISSAISELESELKRKKITLKLRLSDDLPLILADEEKINRVLEHLLRNAISYSPKGKTVTVEARAQNGESRRKTAPRRVAVSVRDMGKGIPAALKNKIFERFFQGENPLTRQKDGVGLGLYYCKRVVEHHGGRIFYENAPGGGTVFTFTLPTDPLLERAARLEKKSEGR